MNSCNSTSSFECQYAPGGQAAGVHFRGHGYSAARGPASLAPAAALPSASSCSAAAWPLAARAQQSAMPVIAFISGRSAGASTRYVAAFRKGLVETGYVEGQNVTVDCNWLEGQYGRLPALLADLINRRVSAIVTPGSTPAAVAAKAATATIPIASCGSRFAGGGPQCFLFLISRIIASGDHRLRGGIPASGNLSVEGIRRSRWTGVLWTQPCGDVAPVRNHGGQGPQGRQAWPS
jgi:hypothetical protein